MLAPMSIEKPMAIEKKAVIEEKSRMRGRGLGTQYRTGWTLQRSCHFPLQGPPDLKIPAQTAPPSKLGTIPCLSCRAASEPLVTAL